MDFEGALVHLKRIRHQLGEPLVLGARAYRVRGYCANRLSASSDHESYMTRVFERALSGRPGAFVDVGTNVGQTLTKVLSIDPARRYVGFEPQIACCFFLDQFIRDNDLGNASVLCVALSDENRMLTLFSRNAYDEMATLEGALDSIGGRRPLASYVPARIGDEVFEEIGLHDIAAIKLDVEGAELQVFRGLERTLRERRPSVVFEVLPNFHGVERVIVSDAAAAKNRARAAAIYAYLESLGYDIQQIDERGDARPIARFELDDRAGYVGSNFMALPR